MTLKVSNIYLFFLMTLVCVSFNSFAQNDAARYEIDAKRIGVLPTDKDALPRSREFLRLDSTYYVGHMYEGIYKWDRSVDYLGFKNAIPALKKALFYFEKDYGIVLKNIYSTPQYYSQHLNKYIDFLQIANDLRECYSNIEMSDSVMWILNEVDKYHFKKDHINVETLKAWTYHRDRFYNSNKYSFLGNSIAENEKIAFGHCYNALYRIERNKSFNDVWFGPNQAENDRQNVYHYLAMLHCYNKNYDSSTHYYELMRQYGQISWNNYGGMQHEIGNIATAIQYFNQDKYKSYQHFLKEPYYMIPLLYIYNGNIKEAISIAKEAINFSKSSPGFGWYNIALGRGFLYDNQLDSAEYVLHKAENFKELHIGTTLTQGQYVFTIQLLKLQLINKKEAFIKFTNKGWWYSPSALFKLLSLRFEKMLLQYTIVNQLAQNPERERLVYELFCSESTTTFDDAWYLLKDLSKTYFIKKYKEFQQTDKRKNIQRYFKLTEAEFLIEKGKYSPAQNILENLVNNEKLDTTNEKLFLGKLYENLIKCYNRNNDIKSAQFYTNVLLKTYPSLIPNSNIYPEMFLQINNSSNELKSIVNEIKKANIHWVYKKAQYIPNVEINLRKTGEYFEAMISTKSSDGIAIVQSKILFKKTENVSAEIITRIFGKGGGLVFDSAN